MMKVVILKEYIDKETKELMKPEKVIEMTEKRMKEINGTEHGAMVAEIKEENKAENKAEPKVKAEPKLKAEPKKKK